MSRSLSSWKKSKIKLWVSFMNRMLKKIYVGFALTAYSILLIYSLLNLEKVSLESCILLVALTYYINKKEIFKLKVNKNKEKLK